MTRKLSPSHIAKVRKTLNDEVIAALRVARRQTSLRQLAREAEISNPLLSQLVAEEFQVTPAVAKRLAKVFDQWGDEYRKLARRVRAAARRVPDLRTGRTP